MNTRCVCIMSTPRLRPTRLILGAMLQVELLPSVAWKRLLIAVVVTAFNYALTEILAQKKHIFLNLRRLRMDDIWQRSDYKITKSA